MQELNFDQIDAVSGSISITSMAIIGGISVISPFFGAVTAFGYWMNS